MSAKVWKNRLLSEVGSTDAYNRLQTRRSVAVSSRRTAEPPDGPPRESLRVLVVDAYRAVADTMSMLVSKWGHDVRRAYDGTAGLALATAYQPDVVLLEIFMPGMSGLELARQVRRQVPSKDCLIIAVAGYAYEHRRRLCSKAGIDLVLIKPVEPPVLETLLMLESEYVRARQDTAPYNVLSTALLLTNQLLELSKRPNSDLLGAPTLIGGGESC